MSDTKIFGRTVKASLKACALYVFADSAVSIGHELLTTDPEVWSKRTALQILGWMLVQAGGVAILVKAFYSNSSKPQS